MSCDDDDAARRRFYKDLAARPTPPPEPPPARLPHRISGKRHKPYLARRARLAAGGAYKTQSWPMRCIGRVDQQTQPASVWKGSVLWHRYKKHYRNC